MEKLYVLLLASTFSAFGFAQSACGNKDFEDQNFTNWNGSVGSATTIYFSYSSGGPMVNGGNNSTLMSTSRQTILTINSLDPNCIDPQTGQPDAFMTTLAPWGGTATVRLGNQNIGFEAEQLTYTFLVSSNDTVFTYWIACVFQDPAHIISNQPRLEIAFYDQAMTNIPSLNQIIVAGDTSFPFIVNPNFPLINYKRWQGYSVNLAAYIGQNVTVTFTNQDCTQGGHFGYSYIDASCFGSYIANVWPGDADYDLNCNNVDLLSIGLAYGANGPVRPGANLSWTAQPSADWSQNFSLAGNFKHCDTDGNGTVDVNDTLAVSQNFSNTHPFRYEPPVVNTALPALRIDAVPTTVGLNTFVNADLILGTSVLDIDSIYGISFKLQYTDSFMLLNNAGFTFSNYWLGTEGNDMITFQKNDFSSGIAYISLVRTDQNNMENAFGTIGSFRFRTVGSAPGGGTIDLLLSDVFAITKTREVVSLSNFDDAIIFDPNFQGVPSGEFNELFSLYPNPSNGNFTLEAFNNAVKKIEIINSVGQIVKTISPNGAIVNFNLRESSSGIYTAKVSCDKGVYFQKLQLVK